jgi:nitroreductase/dihydropteridine reductase
MQANDLARIATTRHTCKAFDPARKIAPADMAALRTVLRCAPSSVNSQPWHFFIAASEAAKARIAEATKEGYAYNTPKILNASQVVVFSAKTGFDDAHVAAILAQEDKDGRFPSAEAKTNQNNSRNFYVNLHRDTLKDDAAWMQKQVYIALGTLLQGAALLGIDACPIEGFAAAKLDAELGLRERGYTAVVLAALGYRSAEDFNAKLPKSRFDEASVITTL